MPDNPICKRPCERAGEPMDYIVEPGISPLVHARSSRVPVAELIRSLEKIREPEFTSRGVADFLRRHPVSVESLFPYVHFERSHYTRNLIVRNSRFEVLLICWEPGQETPIHNHDGQSCWVSLVSGRLSFTNYKWLGCDRERRTVHLERLSRIPIAAEGSLNVIDERDTIHRLSNPADFDGRVISLHIYSKPLDRCVTYDENAGTCEDRSVGYYSVEGVPKRAAAV